MFALFCLLLTACGNLLTPNLLTTALSVQGSAALTDSAGRRTVSASSFTVSNHVPDSASKRWQPRPSLTWQWQLQGKLDMTLPVDVYDIDLFDTPASTIASFQARGVRIICYFSAGSFEAWREDAVSFPASVKGKKMEGGTSAGSIFATLR